MAQWDIYQFEQNKAKSKNFLEKSLSNGFFSDDDSRFSPELKASKTVQEAFAFWKQLGPFQKITAINFVKQISKDPIFFYVVDLQFSKGNTQISVVIERENDAWIYRYLDVDPYSIAQRTLW